MANIMYGWDELNEYEKEGLFALGSSVINIKDDKISAGSDEEDQYPITEKTEWLYRATIDEVVKKVETLITNKKYINKEIYLAEDPEVSCRGRECDVEEMIFINLHSITILPTGGHEYEGYTAFIYQPNRHKRVAVYQILESFGDVHRAGALIMQPNGHYEIKEF
jgi:hypothetical protein